MIPSHTSSGFQEYPRRTSSRGTTVAAAVKHHHRTSHRLIYMGAPVFPLCNLRHLRDLTSTTFRRGILYVLCAKRTFSHIPIFCSSTRGFFSCPRLRGTQEAHVNTAVQIWALAEVRGTCSGGSKSRKLASNHGIRFRPPRANHAYGNHKEFS